MITHNLLDDMHVSGELEVTDTTIARLDDAIKMCIEKLRTEKTHMVDSKRTPEKYEEFVNHFYKKNETLRKSAEAIGVSYDTARNMRDNFARAMRHPRILKFLFKEQIEEKWGKTIKE